jgi:hypothetical protein
MYTPADSAQLTVLFGIFQEELKKTVKPGRIARFREGNLNRELSKCEATIAKITHA